MSDAAMNGPAPATEHRRRSRYRAFGIFMGLLMLLVLLSCAGAWFVFFRTAAIEPGRPVEVDIPAGADTHLIADRLANAGVVANANMFRLRCRAEGADSRLKAGTYDFVTGMDYATVIARLEEGPPAIYVTVTIPEGFTVKQIAERIQAKTGISADEFEQVATKDAKRFRDRYAFLRFNPTDTLEGYLFPKTYRVRKDAKADQVVAQMLDQFQKESAAIDTSYASSKNLTLQDIVTIASMIERETKLPKERTLVSSVIYNRLKRGMRLEIDATVQYVVGNKPRLLYRDLAVKSAYNTYIHKGLPPGPIASPGLASLEAAAHPASTAYLYYVLTSRSGAHTFTTTRDAFERAKERGVR